MGGARPCSHKAGTEQGFVERDEEGLVRGDGTVVGTIGLAIE